MRPGTLLIGAAAAALVAVAVPQPTLAQTYPTQDVHFICAFAAGSGADIIVRYFSEKMRPLMGRSIIVENRVGAIGNLATEYVARSKPDGHVIYVTGASGVAANMHIFKNPSVDVGNALQIAATLNKATMMLGVRADAPWKTAPELTAAMKLKGDKASYAIANPTSKVLGALFKERAGLQSVEVGYRTGADFLNDLYGGNIDYAIPDNIQAMAQARAGRMRILAVGAATRMQSAPDLPTMTELGYPMDVRTWWAALVPAATPRPVVDQLNAWFRQVVATEETKSFLAVIASDPWASTPDEGQAFFREQIKDWGDYVRLTKIEPQG
ncbi:MAG TPA: tripartite tricarboxylate transporter substrate binding protein [Xanthobacteraceae bacterium]|jgi:tripartite-type tricarboxylate transporter receptor subunit TctC|nr:tripartite tricarboxylate transporter substrate binding protein [Xanthobacteraceae bacterium]